MNDTWHGVVVKKITLALWVLARFGKNVHTDRPVHGLVLNDEGHENVYYFSDGRVMHTKSNELFYLPKGSTYRVVSNSQNTAYAINFDADISDEPFTISLRDAEAARKLFRSAARAWKSNSATKELSVMRDLYGIILHMIKESEAEYQPSAQRQILLPAISAIESRFCENTLSVAELASLCNVSEVYFRRIFDGQFGISPKEYIIRRRIEYAKTLLASGQLSVGEIATLCGYTEPCHFSREFKKHTGIPPREYR